MGDLATGMLVKHASLGVGRVVSVEATAVHVFFPTADTRQAAKLRWPTARPLITTEGVERDAWLETLSSFSLDPESGRYTLAANWVTHEQAIADYLSRRPAPGAKRAGSRVDRITAWRAASAELAVVLPPGHGEKLAKGGEYKELVKRLLKVVKPLEGVPGLFEEGVLAAVLKQKDETLIWAEALFSLLTVPSPARARFDALFSATRALTDDPAVAWPLATLFPFLAVPSRHMVLLARPASVATERLGFDLRYTPEPTYPPYTSLRSLAAKLLERLVPHGAKDYADVEALLFDTATHRTPGGAKKVPRAKKATR